MDRPRCADHHPDTNQPDAILTQLLAIEMDRLETAVRIEKERKIVFPETSIIIRDIQKLHEALTYKSKGESSEFAFLDDLNDR